MVVSSRHHGKIKNKREYHHSKYRKHHSSGGNMGCWLEPRHGFLKLEMHTLYYCCVAFWNDIMAT